MNSRQRFQAVMNFHAFDRLPMTESYWWWDKTLSRWYDEGLPKELTSHGEICQHLGLDLHRIFWLSVWHDVLATEADFERIMRPMMDSYELPREELELYAREQQEGRAFLWCQFDGFFWFPRKIMGIERHLLAFYDEPAYMHKLNQCLLEFNLRVLDELCRICTPDVISLAEDMSYNHGPMLSKDSFDEFLAPYYRQLVPEITGRGILPIVDSDGDITRLIPWLNEMGIQGLTPLERMAGTDVNQIRRDWPRWRMFGAFDKTTMNKGEAAMRREFERLLPLMRSGGYLPSCDHQTPPEVSLADYHLYVRLLGEYCRLAAK